MELGAKNGFNSFSLPRLKGVEPPVSNNWRLTLFFSVSRLSFKGKIDNKKFKAILLAKLSINHGGLVPSILNYCNEIMVSLFLQKKIIFTDIVDNNEKIMNKFIIDGNNIINPTVENIIDSFSIIDEYVLHDKYTVC